MITVNVKGNFSKTDRYLEKIKEVVHVGILDRYGREGVQALAAATPKDSGNTAEAWDYEIESKNGSDSIIWTNSNINNGVSIAVILQYGHGTKNGGYVRGEDYINPALKPIMDRIAEEAWKEVTSV